jgi:hypothetical protein
MICTLVDNFVLNELADIQAAGLLNPVFSNVYMPESIISDEAKFPNAHSALREVRSVRAVVETLDGLKFWVFWH